MAEPIAARLHFITFYTSRVQNVLVRVLRRYFERAPGWVLLTTRGRTTGLPREVLLPCERFADGLLILSTYARRSNWMKNLARDPAVRITAAGFLLAARAEIIDDLAAKRALVTAHPFCVPLPFGWLNALHRTVLRPLTVAFLRWWVIDRPVVVVRPTGPA